jgi:protein-disulfide isomerase
MTTNSNSTAPRRLIPWKKRATYTVATSKRLRKKQHTQQKNMIVVLTGATVVFAVMFILINWQNAGAAKAVNCATFPHYCLPLAGGTDAAFSALEASGTRALDEDSHGAPGVVRYIDTDNVPTLGDPNAPVHFRTTSSFTCGHCNNFHNGDLKRFIEDYVLTGQATLGFVLAAGNNYAETASLGALCAGEQGAFWEMSDELFRLARAGTASALTPNEIEHSADTMGLDASALVSCVNSGRYDPVIAQHSAIMNDYGVAYTPTLLVRFEGDAAWAKLDSYGYDMMVTITAQAQPH